MAIWGKYEGDFCVYSRKIGVFLMIRVIWNQIKVFGKMLKELIVVLE